MEYCRLVYPFIGTHLVPRACIGQVCGTNHKRGLFVRGFKKGALCNVPVSVSPIRSDLASTCRNSDQIGSSVGKHVGFFLQCRNFPTKLLPIPWLLP